MALINCDSLPPISPEIYVQAYGVGFRRSNPLIDLHTPDRNVVDLGLHFFFECKAYHFIRYSAAMQRAPNFNSMLC